MTVQGKTLKLVGAGVSKKWGIPVYFWPKSCHPSLKEGMFESCEKK